MSYEGRALTTIVIVNWRGCTDTIECLESLLRVSRQDFNVIVCDNGSRDGSVSRLADWARGADFALPTNDPWRRLPVARVRREVSFNLLDEEACRSAHGPLPFLTIVALTDNVGFAGANNVALRLTRRCSNGDYIWFLNNDTVVAPDAYSALLSRFAADATIGQCGPTLLFYAEPERVQALGGSTYRWGTGRGRHIGIGTALDALPPTIMVERSLVYVSGASLMARRTLLDEIGDMKEEYFLYCEEIELSMRMPAAARLAWAPDAVVWHKEGASIGSRSLGRPSDLSLYYLTRNALAFIARHRPIYLPSVMFVRIVLDGFRLWRKRDMAGVRILGLALFDFLAGRMGKWRHQSRLGA